MIIGTVSPVPSVNGSAPLAKGLRAWYMTQGQNPGKGILQDLSPAGNHAQLLNSATSFAGMPTASSSFLSTDYNGVTGAGKVLSNPQTSNIFSGGGMFSAWVCVDSYTAQPRLFDKNQSYAAFTANNAGNLSLSLFQWFNSGSTIGIFASTTPNDYPVPVGVWTHVAIAYNSDSAANVPSVYVNGSAIAITVSSAPVNSPVNDSADLLFLGNTAAFDRPFDGRMFDVRFYKGFLPDAGFVRAVFQDAFNQFSGTLATCRRHHRKKITGGGGGSSSPPGPAINNAAGFTGNRRAFTAGGLNLGGF